MADGCANQKRRPAPDTERASTTGPPASSDALDFFSTSSLAADAATAAPAQPRAERKKRARGASPPSYAAISGADSEDERTTDRDGDPHTQPDDEDGGGGGVFRRPGASEAEAKASDEDEAEADASPAARVKEVGPGLQWFMMVCVSTVCLSDRS